MDINKYSETEAVEVEPGRKRRLIHTDNLMVIEWEFTGGPWQKPDPPHSHPHEQVTYIVEGQVLFFHGDDKCQLSTGDMVSVAPDVPHSIQLLSPKVRLIDTFTPLRREFL